MYSAQIIEQARNTYHYAVLYSKSTNLNNLNGIAGKKAQDKDKENNIKQ